MNWIWIALIVIAGCAIVNPILYFIYWEIYKRKEWIEDQEYHRNDARFWSDELSEYERRQIAPLRPQIKDVWDEMDNYWLWWFPVVSTFTALFYMSTIIAKPFETSWKRFVRKIANIKV